MAHAARADALASGFQRALVACSIFLVAAAVIALRAANTRGRGRGGVMPARVLTVRIGPASPGWQVVRSDGRLLARFRGLCSRRRALRYAERIGHGGAR